MKQRSLLFLLLAAGLVPLLQAFYPRALPAKSSPIATAELEQYEDARQARSAFLVEGAATPSNTHTLIRAVVSYDTVAKRVKLSWSRHLANDILSPRVSREDMVATRYHPTAIAAISPTELLVAGVTPDDTRVIVEKWRFEYPSFGISSPGGSTVTSLSLLGGGRESVEIVYNQPRGISGRVWMMSCNQGALGDSALVFMDGQSELYALSLQDHTLDLIASAASSTGHLGVVHELGLPWQSLTVLDHETDGHVYALAENLDYLSLDLAAEGDLQIRWLAFYDFDRDGIIDNATPMNSVAASVYPL
jgi:hypothetical protein